MEQTNLFQRLGVMFSAKSDEHYTPDDILKRVYCCFGFAGVTLDPCSNSKNPELANVKADSYYTIEDNGLNKPWVGNIYLNPPYSDNKKWIPRIVGAFESGEIDQAIILVPARTSENWFQPLYKYPLCFIKNRLTFKTSKEAYASHNAPFPSVLIYLGSNGKKFIDSFEDIGNICYSLDCKQPFVRSL